MQVLFRNFEVKQKSPHHQFFCWFLKNIDNGKWHRRLSLRPKKTQKTWLLLVITFDDGECARHRVCGESDLPLFPACQSLDQMMTKQHFSYIEM